ncbi:MAG: hypothetical protein HQL32_10395 [Planctomycetes bacterium]|nr:hypothetical protein [Planctomycetota bacterium]
MSKSSLEPKEKLHFLSSILKEKKKIYDSYWLESSTLWRPKSLSQSNHFDWDLVKNLEVFSNPLKHFILTYNYLNEKQPSSRLGYIITQSGKNFKIVEKIESHTHQVQSQNQDSQNYSQPSQEDSIYFCPPPLGNKRKK